MKVDGHRLDVVRGDRNEHASNPLRQQEAKRASGAGEAGALRQELPGEIEAARAESQAHREDRCREGHESRIA